MVFKLPWNECSECLKIVFFTFLEFLSDGVESVFRESKAKPWKLFKSKVYHGKPFSCLEVKNEYYIIGVWKWCFLFFGKFLSDKAENIFWDSKAKPSKLLNSKVWHMNRLRKSLSSYLEVKNEYS